MKIRSITAAYFSPTGHARDIVMEIAEKIAAEAGLCPDKGQTAGRAADSEAGGLAGAFSAQDAEGQGAGKSGSGDGMASAKAASPSPVRVIDFTLPAARRGQDGQDCSEILYRFGPGDLVIFGTPVYAGRIPNKILPAFQALFAGNGALAVPVATFGNRSFDNALIEMRNELEAHGFHAVAGAAFVSEHVFSDKLATGRPNADDKEAIRQFAGKVFEKIDAIAPGPMDEAHHGMAQIPAPVAVKGQDPIPGYYRPLGKDGKPAVFLKAKPKTSDACNDCGLCARVCPMGSISPEDFRTVTGVCIKCHACIKACPQQAKYFDDAALLSHIANLEDCYQRRAGNEVFL